MAALPPKATVFGVKNPSIKRVFAAAAITMWALMLLAFVASILEDTMRPPPSFAELIVVEGRFLSHGRCSGKGHLRRIDLTVEQASGRTLVRVPCTEEFASLTPGMPLKLHMRWIVPHLCWPPYSEVWHASSVDRVLYSYEARMAREEAGRWWGYALAAGALLFIGPMLWLLSKWAWDEANAELRS